MSNKQAIMRFSISIFFICMLISSSCNGTHNPKSSERPELSPKDLEVNIQSDSASNNMKPETESFSEKEVAIKQPTERDVSNQKVRLPVDDKDNSEVSVSNTVAFDELKEVPPQIDENGVENQGTVEDSFISEPPSVIQTEEPEEKIQTPGGHELWQKVLTKFVTDDGRVDYSGIKKNRETLDAYIVYLNTEAPPKNDLSMAAKVFWLNAYNAFTVKLIVDNFPLKSITELDDGNPWDKKWIKTNSGTYSLNNIEHDIIRKNWKDARIHFAVNCAAKSCPPISNSAFQVQNLDSHLDKLTKDFVANQKFNSISRKKIELSKIFEWYASDFGDIIGFVNKYSNSNVSKGASISFLEYDWTLNGG